MHVLVSGINRGDGVFSCGIERLVCGMVTVVGTMRKASILCESSAAESVTKTVDGVLMLHCEHMGRS